MRRFRLGTFACSPGVLEVLGPMEAQALLHRHARGDWGDVTLADVVANDTAAELGQGRIISGYVKEDGRIIILHTDLTLGTTEMCLFKDFAPAFKLGLMKPNHKSKRAS